MTLCALYDMIDNRDDIELLTFSLPQTESISMPIGDKCYIGIDYSKITSTADEKEKIAHELGHCVKGAFYNRHSKHDIISRHEYRADKWACEQLVPRDELEEAFQQGYVEVWQLAEYFNVPERLVKRAVWIYFDKVI
ncbi:MAG: ImmA/IrrE family metallo-endopeptidase [Oscillospiraceae bacterium]|nr:ImmA/IrrE family metallo-endopeptidase [Oscillospiraceae bacterium]